MGRERSQARPWHTPEELVEIGFSRARLGYNGNMRQYGKDTC